MKRTITMLTIAFTALSLFAATAEAKRFGGGGSFGKQRATTPQQDSKAPAATPAPTATPAPAGNKWLGPLAGLAIGAGLGAMFAGGGLGGAMGGILMAMLAAGVLMFLISKFRKPQTMQYAGSGAPYSGGQRPVLQPLSGGSPASVAAGGK